MMILGLALPSMAQTRRDPRGMALAGAYGVMARGLFTVDYNPANLAIQGKYNSYRLMGGISTSFSNNFISLQNYNEYNGKDLEADGGKLKQQFMDEIPSNGWRIFTDLHIPLPYLNFSRANKAFTSDLIMIGDIGLPKGMMQFIFDGNPIGEELSLDFNEEFLLMNQLAYSFAFPVSDFFVGFTFKYLQGISYLGLNPDSSHGSIVTYFEPGKNYITGEGYYLFQQSIGGRGFGMDFGITSKEIKGYRFGFSVTNIFGRINWNKSTLISRIMGDKGFFWDGDHYVYQFQVNEARFDKFFGKSDYDDIFPGGGETVQDSTEFVMRYPSLARFSASKWLEDGIQISTDFVVGFEDRLYSFGAWKWCTGLEFTRSPKLPIRVGVSFGGKDHRQLSFGSGYHAGFIHFDWALGLNHGLWFTTAKGIDFSLVVYTTGKRKDFKKNE